MIAKEIEDYSRQHRLIGENLFEDWEGFLDFLYEKGVSVKAILFYECKDGRYEQTRIMMNGLEEDSIEEVKTWIRSTEAEHPNQKLLPCFYLYDRDMPDLSAFDDRCVRLTDFTGDVYEGNARHFSDEYAWQEFGRFEEGLQLVCYLFYYDQIRSIESLNDCTGPYGRFSAPYGKLEEDSVKDGPDIIDEFLFSEDSEHIERMLRCLKDFLKPESGIVIPEREKTLQLIRKYAGTEKDEVLRRQAEEILKEEEERKA